MCINVYVFHRDSYKAIITNIGIVYNICSPLQIQTIHSAIILRGLWTLDVFIGRSFSEILESVLFYQRRANP